MARRTQKIDELLAVLEKTGADPERLDGLRATQRFKRSWVDLAEVLVRIRKSGGFKDWGYTDFHAYCSGELQLRKATVDKLTISYSTIQKHAPAVLQRDGVAKTIPSYEAIDYFARAVPDEAANAPKKTKREPPDAQVVKDLRAAVFQEGQSVGELRKRFDPVIRPKAPKEVKLETVKLATRLAAKLAQVLPDVEGVSEKRLRQVEAALGGLRGDLDDLAESLKPAPKRKKDAGGERKKAPPRAATS